MKSRGLIFLIFAVFSLLGIVSCGQPVSQAGLRQLTFEEGDQYYADWSPDGKTIVYEAEKSKEATSIWTIHADGSGAKELLKENNIFLGAPVFNQDGSKIAYSRAGGQYRIWVMGKDGSARTQLEGAAGRNYDFPKWSPDGSKIAYTEFPFPNPKDQTQRELRVMNSDGSNSIKLSEGLEGRVIKSWNPDGKTIVFESGEHLWKINADGSGLTQLTNSEGIKNRYPDWSADGSRIVFQSQKQGNDRGQLFSIEVINSDGTNRRTLIDNHSHEGWDAVGEPRWSPDGRMIVFTVKKGQHFELWIADYVNSVR